MNILLIINKAFLEQAEAKFNPRNSMMISRNDGMFDSETCHCRDTIISSNSLIYLSRDKYTQEQIENIRRVKAM